MKKTILTLLLLSSIFSYTQKITRGPDIGEIYFLGPTYTGTGLYYSTDSGEAAVCVDSINFTNSTIEAISADKTSGTVYYVTMGEALYFSNTFGEYGSWEIHSGGISYRINSGRTEGEFYNTISSHSTDYGINFINHTINGYFGNLLECGIDCESSYCYAIVYKSSVSDSIFLLASQDNYDNIQLQNSFYVNYYSRANLTRGSTNGELYLDLAQNNYTENSLLRSENFGETFNTIEEFNLSNFYQLDFEGGRQEGEIYILYNFVNMMWLNAHTYIFHSIDYGKTFEVFHPFSKGNEPVLANFSTVEKEIQLTYPLEFCNFSIGDNVEYQWDFDNDGTIDSYEQFPTYTYADTGYFSVKLSVVGVDSTNTFMKENYIHIIDTTTSINQYTSHSFSIAPNPVYDQLCITSNAGNKDFEVSIYNLQGVKMINTHSEKQILPIDFSTMPSGIYLIEIRTEDSKNTYKIIKK